jgi:hypothetical protein
MGTLYRKACGLDCRVLLEILVLGAMSMSGIQCFSQNQVLTYLVIISCTLELSHSDWAV